MIGKTLAHYEITAALGRGGMGEVFKAKDQKLGRDVAIKVLPEEFAKDSDRVARFQREAKLLASLNHPNIAAIYGLEESGGTRFLVLELVEGQTLADRIKAGPVPVEESLKLALQIAEALEAAHEKGVIHRDLKPANIKVTPDGKVKVLDFGLAKAYAGEQAELNLSNSPTLSDMATQQGVILGTAAYMSPEQAKGKAVDKRTDIWAFGCVLYEMLTGQAAFQGDDVTEILAAVVKLGPNMDFLPANIHPRVREVITRCLQKEQKKRYPEIGEAHYEIEKVLSDPSGVFVQPITAKEPRARLGTILPWAAAALVVGLVIAGIAVWNLRKPEPRHVTRFEYELPERQQFYSTAHRVFTVLPNGRQFVYATATGLYLHSLDEFAAKLIAGTEGITLEPFFSPDAQWIGYFCYSDRTLKKISINGGTPVTLCTVGSLLGAWWDKDNTIVYGQDGGDIMRISADGKNAKPLVKLQTDNPAYPQILPDGKSLLYTLRTSPTQGRIMVHSPGSGESRELFAGTMAQYIPTGHIVYRWQNDIYAIAFDVDKLEVLGERFSIIEGVGQAAVSDAGTVVYIPAAASEELPAPSRTLFWVDRDGNAEPLPAPLKHYRHPNISPDGTRVALSVIAFSGGDESDIYTLRLADGHLARLTFQERHINVTPVWTPDSKRIAFYCARAAINVWGVFLKAADGAGKEEILASLKELTFLPYSWSCDGKALIGVEAHGVTQFDIGMISMEGEHKRKLLFHESCNENQPKISPDGLWIAYTSNESGRNEIYVRPYPNVDGGKWQVSTDGGDSPVWSPDSHELFYRNGNAVMAVPVKTDPRFIFETPSLLFRGTYVQESPLEGTPWDIHPHSKRFLMMKEAELAAGAAALPRPKINIILNWFEELKQRVPVK